MFILMNNSRFTKTKGTNRYFSRCDGRCPKYRGRAWKRGIFGQECNQTNPFHRKKMIKAPYFVRYCLSTKNSSVSPVSLRCQQCITVVFLAVKTVKTPNIKLACVNGLHFTEVVDSTVHE